MRFNRFPAPAEPVSDRPVCGTCRRPIAPGSSCVAFPSHHVRCIERSVWQARDAEVSWE